MPELRLSFLQRERAEVRECFSALEAAANRLNLV